MAQKKSSRKITTITVRFRDEEKLEAVRQAAAIEDLPLNKFIVRSSVAAAVKVKAANSSAK